MSLAIGPSSSAVAWHGGYGRGSAIYVQLLDARGQFLGAPWKVSDGPGLAYEPDLIFAGDHAIVAWYEKNTASLELTAWLASVDPHGSREWKLRLGDGRHWARNPVVRQIGDRLHLAWIERDRGKNNRADVMHQIVSLSGKPITRPAVIGRANKDTWNLNATVDGERLILTYDAAQSAAVHELRMVIVDQTGARTIDLGAADGFASLYPDYQVNSAGYGALTWFDEKDGNREVYLSVGPAKSFEEGKLPRPKRITHSLGESSGAYLAWNGSRLGLAWIDEIAGTPKLFEQSFDEKGRPLMDRVMLSTSSEPSSVPSIRARGDGFLIGWNDYRMRGSGAHANVFSSAPKIAFVPVGNND